MRRTILLACALMGLAACGESKTPVLGAVLGPGQSIEARNASGRIRISYVSPTRRRYEWDGGSRVVHATVRPEPWLGELGIYDPAGSFSPRNRLVMGEAVTNFEDIGQIYAYLYQGSAVMDWVYTDDGLVVGFNRIRQLNTLSVDVRQLLLNGRKPSGLCGARPAQVRFISDRAGAERTRKALATYLSEAQRLYGVPALRHDPLPPRTCEDMQRVFASKAAR